MKIDSKNSIQQLNTGTSNAAGAANAKTDKAAESAKPTSAPSLNVQLSPLSSQLQALQASQASNAVFEAKKVEEIKLAISEGRFQVDAEKVADGLLETVKELLNTRRQPT